MRIKMGVALFVSSGMVAAAVWAHEGMRHPAAEEVPAQGAGKENSAASPGSKTLVRINESYLRQVKPIFFEKCFDCHGSGRSLPWYARIPGPRQLIQYDIRTARKHLEMDKGFPFGGHASQLEHLKALEEVLKDGSMPPWRYRVMHRGSRLTPQEVAVIQAWIDESKKLLETQGGHE